MIKGASVIAQKPELSSGRQDLAIRQASKSQPHVKAVPDDSETALTS